MKTKRLRRNQSALINPSRWAAYATAGAASALACAPSAEGDVVYSGPINRSFTLPPGDHQETFQHFALTGNIELDFQLVNIPNGPFGMGGVAHFRLGPQGFFPGAATQVVGSRGSLAPNAATIYLSRLGFGQNLASQHFTAFQHYPISAEPDGRAYFGTLAAYGGFPHSHWSGSGLTGFIGFRFDAGAGTQLGWAQIRMDSGPNSNTYTVIDYAFAGPGEGLSTGQIPEPSSLGLLALGGVGVLVWRKRRAHKAEQQAA